MAANLRTPTNLLPCQQVMVNTKSFDTPKHLFIKQKRLKQQLLPNLSNVSSISMKNKSIWVPKFLSFAASGEATEINEVEETQTQENLYDEVLIDDSISDGIAYAEEKTSAVIMELLQSYREALASNDESKVAEIGVLLQSIEDEKKDLANKVVTLSAELSSERERVLRISADFAFLRKRMEEVRLSLVTNVRGEVVESMRTILDNFERTKSQIKVETEGEEKIKNSYQSIFKQFQEILGSLSIVPESTAGNPFNPMVSMRNQLIPHFPHLEIYNTPLISSKHALNLSHYRMAGHTNCSGKLLCEKGLLEKICFRVPFTPLDRKEG